ncbi:MAG: B12-binding domain-containing radical SAM protein [Candidatus Fermentibacteraceae bacterium]|nr:B12-binding domain-containing radical SAM protein [Candidatus Fermentibacteraceae bacterium]
MKVLFLVHDNITIPLGIGYIASIVSELGHEISTLSLNMKDLTDCVRDEAPDILAFGTTTGFHRKYSEVAKRLKEATGVLTIMGGAHPTFFPEVMEENPWLDFAMRGEAETAFPQFLEVLEGRRSIGDVGNLIYRENGQILENRILPLVEDLDTIPFPQRNLLPGENKKAVFCITGRGCPYNCSYCFNQSYRQMYKGLGKYCRRRSVGNVIDELKELKEENTELQMIIFQDDIFILDHDWVREFCQKYSGEIALPFHCHLRANLVTDEIMELLAETGCISVKMALEAASSRLRKNVLNRDLSNEDLLNACRSVKQSGIMLVTQNILGIPTGTLEDDLDTLRMNYEVQPDFAFATLMQPYPRTRICEFSKEQGLLDDETFIPDSFFDDCILKLPDNDRRKRLRQLFAISIEFKAVRYMLKILMRLPLDGLYGFMDKLWKGYCIKQREFPYKLSFREYVSSMLTYFSSRYY